MKKRILPLLLGFVLLTACGGRTCDLPADSPAVETPTCVEPVPTQLTCRIVDGAEEGSLLLAELGEGLYAGTGVYRLSVDEDTEIYLDEEPADADVLEDGMVVDIWFDGTVLETYPAKFSGVTSIDAWSQGSKRNPGGSCYDLCGLYLQVLDDLWQVDSALNTGITIAGLDLSNAPGNLTASEKNALAWRFGELHGVEVVTENFTDYYTQVDLGEVVEEGPVYYEWTDGCLFAIEPHATDQVEVYSLATVNFDASKWKGPLAAYCFYDCTAVWPQMGTWSGYNVGAEMIS